MIVLANVLLFIGCQHVSWCSCCPFFIVLNVTTTTTTSGTLEADTRIHSKLVELIRWALALLWLLQDTLSLCYLAALEGINWQWATLVRAYVSALIDGLCWDYDGRFLGLYSLWLSIITWLNIYNIIKVTNNNAFLRQILSLWRYVVLLFLRTHTFINTSYKKDGIIIVGSSIAHNLTSARPQACPWLCVGFCCHTVSVYTRLIWGTVWTIDFLM